MRHRRKEWHVPEPGVTRRVRRQVISLLIAGAMSASLAACGSSTAGGGTSGGAAGSDASASGATAADADTAGGSAHRNAANADRPHVRIGLCQQNMMDGTPRAIRAAFPDVEFEFIITNNSADYNVYLYEHDDLPDILTIRRFSLNDATALKDTLVDLRSSDIAAGYYQNYLQSFTYEDGTVNWLPAIAEVWGLVANKTLFDECGIELPTDYASFAAACAAFEEQGIKGFETDWKYDYSSLETLEGFNIDLLQSLEGRRWRASYESGQSTGADDVVWPTAFETMYQVLQDTDNIDPAGTSAEDSLITRGYSAERSAMENHEVAMIRASGADIIGFNADTGDEYVMLPYYGQGENWLLTYPYYSAAINKNSDVDQELLLEIYTFMLGRDGQDTLDTGEYMISYTTDVAVEANDLLSNLNTYISNNQVFVRLANNDAFAACQKAVQGMITGEYDAAEAYEVFDASLREQAEGVVYDYTVDTAYSYAYQDGKGSESVSAMLNSAREVWGTDLAVTFAPCYSNSIYAGKAASSQIAYYLSSNPPTDYYLELTGAEVKSLVATMLHTEPDEHGMYAGMSPVQDDMLPVSSGFEMQVLRTEDGYALDGITIDGAPIEEGKTYTICYNVPSYYATYIAAQAGITIPEDSLNNLPAIKDTLTQYLITDGKQFAAPTAYITIK